MITETIAAFSWHNAIGETYQSFSQRIVEYFPQLLGAFALLAVGWILACILRLSTRKLIEGVDAPFEKASKNDRARRIQLKPFYTLIIAQGVYWIVILFFVTASANLLGWDVFTGWMDRIVDFLPKLIAGLLIILGGFLVSAAVRSAILSATLKTSDSQASRLARGAQIVIISSAVIAGVEQIGFNMQFLTSLIVVTIGILLAGACLAFALGAKTMAANAIGAQYTRKHCRPGEYIQIGEFEGEILEIKSSCIILETKNGRTMIPAKLFNEQISMLRSVDDEVLGSHDTSSRKDERHE